MSEPQTVDPQPTPLPAAPPPARHTAFDPRHKSPVLAGMLSLMPGLGQVYIGYYQRGFVHILVVASLIAILSADVVGDAIPLFAFFLVFFWLYNILDAARRAAFYNHALAGGEELAKMQLPGDVTMAGPPGSIAGGTVLVVVGFVLLLDTRFGMSLDWIEDWWPMAPILLGGYLIYMAIVERRALAEDAA